MRKAHRAVMGQLNQKDISQQPWFRAVRASWSYQNNHHLYIKTQLGLVHSSITIKQPTQLPVHPLFSIPTNRPNPTLNYPTYLFLSHLHDSTLTCPSTMHLSTLLTTATLALSALAQNDSKYPSYVNDDAADLIIATFYALPPSNITMMLPEDFSRLPGPVLSPKTALPGLAESLINEANFPDPPFPEDTTCKGYGFRCGVQ